MILRICALILPASKREVFEEAWAADLSHSPKFSVARLWLGFQFLVASLRIRAANDSTQLVRLIGFALLAVPVVIAYLQLTALRELIVGAVFLAAYRYRNLAAVRLNRAIIASVAQMFIAASFSWSRGFLVRDSASFNSFWQSFGLLPTWVPIGLGLLTLVAAILALGLWAWAAVKSQHLNLIEKILFVTVLAAGFPQLLWEVSDSIRLIGGNFLPEALIVAISRLQNLSSDWMLVLVLAGVLAWSSRYALVKIRAGRSQYRSPRKTSTSESQTVDA